MEITDAKTLSNEIPDQQTFDMSGEKMIFEHNSPNIRQTHSMLIE